MTKLNKNNDLISFVAGCLGRQIFIPVAGLFILLVFNLVNDPEFLRITLSENSSGNSVLSGNIISVIDNASELVILAAGMTLVTSATGGQDISIGSVIAVSGSVLFRVLCGSETQPDTLHSPLWLAFLACCASAVLLGSFNGWLVAFFNIQPMIATLILYTAGRSVAAWINSNELPVVNDTSFGWFGSFFPGIPLPAPVIISAACILAAFLVLRFTKLGLFTQAVGTNEKTASLNGIDPKAVKFIVFIILGLCCAVTALVKTSRIQTINYSVIAKDIEMDVILAVALGGNSLSGGKFSLAASVLGAYEIQLLTVTLYKMNVGPETLPVYKAAAVIILVVISSPVVRTRISEVKNKISDSKKKEGI